MLTLTAHSIALPSVHKLYKFTGETQGSYKVLTALLLVCITFIAFLYEKRRKALRLSDFVGPWGLPFVGNIYDIKPNAAEQYREWSHQYGDVFQIQLGDIPVLVINSANAAKRIFSGHSNALSSRPVLYTFHKVLISFLS